MIPTQFQYRDLINHTLSGFLFILTFSFFIGDFNPVQLGVLFSFFDSHLNSFSGIIVVVLVVGFILSYVVGSMLSQTYTNIKNVAFQITYKGNNIIDRVENSIVIHLCKVLMVSKVRDTKISPLIDNSEDKLFANLIQGKINETWKIRLQNIRDEKDLTTLFELCRSYVESQPSSLSNIDIERHFAHQLFSSRLALLFLFGFYFSIIETINSIFNWVPTYTNISSGFWFLISIFFWFQARNSILRTINNYRHWTRTIYYAFINCRIEEKL